MSLGDVLTGFNNKVSLLFHEAFSAILRLWNSIPVIIRFFILLVLSIAVLNIIISLIKGIIENKSKWKAYADSKLMYSFSAGSGQFQRRLIYKSAHRFLFDKKWSIISFAGLAFRLGNYENNSRFITFACTLLYIPLAIMGMVEMTMRSVLGVIVYFALNVTYFVFLLLLWLINLILMPIFFIVDKSTWETQHCPKCYNSFRLPVFECPECGKKHSRIYPGVTGLLWAKCSCGHFIPCASISKRKKLVSYCPKCNNTLAASNIKSLTIQVIGGNSSGKTAFISSFQHLYLANARKNKTDNVKLSPEEDFQILEDMYLTGYTIKSSGDEVKAYYIIHEGTSDSDDGLVFYDVPDEVILSEQYEKNPLNFGYCDGIIVIIDPTSVSSVRKECESVNGSNSTNGYSSDSAEDIIVHFITKYSEIAGRSAKKMSDVPLAIAISKADLTPIKRKIGMVKIKSEYSNQGGRYLSISEARDSICRNYLSEIGLANAINNLESVFSNVSFFPISSIGHVESNGTPYEPFGVIEPVDWIATRGDADEKLDRKGQKWEEDIRKKKKKRQSNYMKN